MIDLQCNCKESKIFSRLSFTSSSQGFFITLFWCLFFHFQVSCSVFFHKFSFVINGLVYFKHFSFSLALSVLNMCIFIYLFECLSFFLKIMFCLHRDTYNVEWFTMFFWASPFEIHVLSYLQVLKDLLYFPFLFTVSVI